MTRTAKGEAVYDRLANDEARTTLRWIMEGRLDADLLTLIRNAQRRQKTALRVEFRVGTKVRVVASGTKHDGVLGTVVKINPTRVVVLTEHDRALAERAHGDLAKAVYDLGELAAYASLAVPAPMLEVVE